MYPDIYLRVIRLLKNGAHTRSEENSDQWPVSQNSRNFSGLFRVSQFPTHLRNAEVLSHQTSQSSWFFLHLKHVKRLAFQNKWNAVW